MAQRVLEVRYEINGLASSLLQRQRPYEMYQYKFESLEEAEEYKQRYAEARMGNASTGEQKNASDRIYKSICMKRRMKAKALKKQQK